MMKLMLNRYASGELRSYFYKKYGRVVEPAMYMRILKAVNKAIVEHVLAGYIYMMPVGLGRLYISKRIPKVTTKTINGKLVPIGRYVDFGETNKLRKKIQPTWTNNDWKKLAKEDRPVVMYDNSHSDGYRYIITWSKKVIAVRNSKFYAFRPVRAFKRELAYRIKTQVIPKYYETKFN